MPRLAPRLDWPDFTAHALRYHQVEMFRPLNLLALLALLVSLAPQCAFAEGLAGKWKLVWDTEGGVRHSVWDIRQNSEAVSVETDGQKLAGTFKDGHLELSGKFHAGEAGYSAELKVEATLENGKLKGRGSWDAYAMTFTGERVE